MPVDLACAINPACVERWLSTRRISGDGQKHVLEGLAPLKMRVRHVERWDDAVVQRADDELVEVVSDAFFHGILQVA